MQYLTYKKYENVGMYRFGYSPMGRPLLSVYCYLLDDLLLDTAQYNCERKVMQTFENEQINIVLLTHWHEDHSGNAASLTERHKAKLLAPEQTIPFLNQGFSGLFYERLLFGSLQPFTTYVQKVTTEIITENYRLQPIFTPGHSVDHTVYLEPDKGWLFSGDLFVGVQIKYFRQGEKFWQQVDSFKKVMEYDFDVLFCGHYPRLSNGKQWLQRKIDYFENFGGMVLEFRNKGLSISEIMRVMRLRENHLIRLLTSNDVSLRFMVKAATNSE